MTHAMLGLFNLGGGEIILILVVLFMSAMMAAVVTASAARTRFVRPASESRQRLVKHPDLASMTPYSIRQAREQVSGEIARLAGQLGYPAADGVMRERLQRLLTSPSDVVFVAEAANGGLVGWIHGVLSQFLESDYRVEIAGLVVDKRFLRRGVGRALVERVERWAMEHGVEQASVRCRTTRAEAHQFYQSLGYSQAKTQIVFRKSLAQPPNKDA